MFVKPCGCDDVVIKPQRNKTQKRRKHIQKGHWLLEENAKYYLFLRSHLVHFKSSHLRRL